MTISLLYSTNKYFEYSASQKIPLEGFLGKAVLYLQKLYSNSKLVLYPWDFKKKLTF